VRLRTLTTLLLALAAALAAGCGADEEGKELPRQTASQLLAQLQSIQDRFEFPGGEACADITGGDDPNITRVQDLIASLPDDVDADLRDAVEQSFDRLFQLVDQECGEVQPETDTETEPTETETTPTETETETTETEPTETIPTETLPTETVPTEELPPGQGGEPPGQGGDNPGLGDGGAGGPEDDE
jgi:hypothetical protein